MDPARKLGLCDCAIDESVIVSESVQSGLETVETTSVDLDADEEAGNSGERVSLSAHPSVRRTLAGVADRGIRGGGNEMECGDTSKWTKGVVSSAVFKAMNNVVQTVHEASEDDVTERHKRMRSTAQT